MYQIVISNNNEDIEIHSPYANQVKCTKAQIKKGINSFDALDLSFLPDNPAFNKIRPLRTLVTVYNTKTAKVIYRGRFLTPEDNMDSSGKFEFSYVCADEKSYLQDSIQPYKKMQNTTPAQAFEYLINIHNSLVEPNKQFKIGKVEVTNSTDNVYRYIDAGTTTWNAIMDKLVNRLGGELRVRHENGIRYLDWLNEIGKVSTTKISLAKNLKSISRTVDPTEVITRLYPYGAQIEDETSNDAAKPRVTIASLNGGKEYLEASVDLIEEFGIIGKSKQWDDIHKPDILLSTAKKYLENQKTLLSKYTVEAVDLSLIGLDIENFSVGSYYQVINPVMSIDEKLRIIGMTLDLINVETSSLTIGDKFLTQSEYQLAAYKNGENINDLGNKIQGLQIINSSQQEKLNDLSDTVNDIDLGPIQTEINKKPSRSEIYTQKQVNELLKKFASLKDLENYVKKEDTGWLVVSSNTLFARCKNGVVEIDGYLNMVAGATGTNLNISLPKGIPMPTRTRYIRVDSINNKERSCMLILRTNGIININNGNIAPVSDNYSFIDSYTP